MYRNKTILIFLSISLLSCKSNNFDSQDQFGNSLNQGSILERPLPDSRGIITYKDYQILVASGNETVEQIAKRLNIDPIRLASYNGVVSNYLPRDEEVLALPIKISGEVINPNSEWNIETTKKSIENIENFNSNIGTPDNPLKHRVALGETAYSIARLYNVSINSLAKWNGLDADFNIVVGRELIIPVILSNKKNNTLELKETSSTKIIDDSSTIENKSKKETTSLEVSKVDKETNTKKEIKNNPIVQKFIRPVSGIILRKYNPTSVKNKNEGIDFAAEPGTPIKSAAEGVIALISEPVGGLGKIILIKHKDSIISIYGRVKEVKIIKGARVEAGQVIGTVEKSFINNNNTNEKQNYLHFELRKGTESLDPEPLFK